MIDQKDENKRDDKSIDQKDGLFVDLDYLRKEKIMMNLIQSTTLLQQDEIFSKTIKTELLKSIDDLVIVLVNLKFRSNESNSSRTTSNRFGFEISINKRDDLISLLIKNRSYSINLEHLNDQIKLDLIKQNKEFINFLIDLPVIKFVGVIEDAIIITDEKIEDKNTLNKQIDEFKPILIRSESTFRFEIEEFSIFSSKLFDGGHTSPLHYCGGHIGWSLTVRAKSTLSENYVSLYINCKNLSGEWPISASFKLKIVTQKMDTLSKIIPAEKQFTKSDG